MTEFNRKPVFDAIRPMLDGPLTQARVQIIDAAIDAGLGIAAPVSSQQIGLTLADYQSAATALACTVAQIRAVDEVESQGGWFKDVRADILALDGPGGFIDGPHLVKILFEAHIFDRHTDGKFRQSHPNLSSQRWNRALYVGGQGEWARLYRAMQLAPRAALMSASVGRYQIMGFNHKAAGFDTVEQFWDAMKRSERDHLDAFVNFIRNAKLLAALRAISNSAADCVAFARGYNGQGFAANSYDVKLAAAHRKWSGA